MSHICCMSKIVLDECKARGHACIKVIWNNVPIGLIRQDENEQWRYDKDLVGEFWSLNEFTDKEQAIAELVSKRQELDEFRVRQLTGK
jgi:hypothetical protein